MHYTKCIYCIVSVSLIFFFRNQLLASVGKYYYKDKSSGSLHQTGLFLKVCWNLQRIQVFRMVWFIPICYIYSSHAIYMFYRNRTESSILLKQPVWVSYLYLFYNVMSFNIQHPEYNTTSKANDIALVRLKTPAVETKPLTFATNTSGDFAGKRCTIAGWGRKHCK